MKIVVFGAVFSLIFSLSAQAYERIAVADRIKLDEAKEVIPKLINGKQACFVSKDFKFPIKYSTHNRGFSLGRYLKTFKKIGNLYPNHAEQGMIALNANELAVCDNDASNRKHGILILQLYGGRRG